MRMFAGRPHWFTSQEGGSLEWVVKESSVTSGGGFGSIGGREGCCIPWRVMFMPALVQRSKYVLAGLGGLLGFRVGRIVGPAEARLVLFWLFFERMLICHGYLPCDLH